MKRLVLFMLLSFCLVFSASALTMMGTSGNSDSGETNQELGYTTTGSAVANTNTVTDRCSKQTTSGAMTVSYGYFYTADTLTNDSGQFYMAVYANDAAPDPDEPGTQVGGCSDQSSVITNDSDHWAQVTWSSDYPSLSAGTIYWVCTFPDQQTGTSYENGSAQDEMYEDHGLCTDPADTTASSRNTYQSVANYDAR